MERIAIALILYYGIDEAMAVVKGLLLKADTIEEIQRLTRLFDHVRSN